MLSEGASKRSERLLNRAVKTSFQTLSPKWSHELMLRQLRLLDSSPKLLEVVAKRLSAGRDSAGRDSAMNFALQPVVPPRVGRVSLDTPLIVAAGLVKGDGFRSEADAMNAVKNGRNIIAGWRTVPRLAGPVEFGTFTPLPRMGNSGTVLWRDAKNQTLYNRIGLRNPGAKAAAKFLSRHSNELPEVYGISLACDPDDQDPTSNIAEIAKAASEFASLRPSWLTVNLSCPNTDPACDVATGRVATEPPERANAICAAVRQAMPEGTALWAKVGPDLSEQQYQELAQALAEAETEAIVATNTVSKSVPGLAGTQAGMGGKMLHEEALRAVRCLSSASPKLAVVGCGGVLDGESLLSFLEAGAVAVQYWSALVFRGPGAGSLILQEASDLASASKTVSASKSARTSLIKQL